jgi:hypothetical protein
MRLLFIFVLIATMTVGCRKSKSVTATDITERAEIGSRKLEIGNYHAPSCRLEISIGGQSFSLGGSIYIQPDSVFYFRGRMLIDVVRGAIYQDRFVVVNYLERVYYTGSNTFLQSIAGFPVNPQSLMEIFTDDSPELNRLTMFNVVYDNYNQSERFDLPTFISISAQHDTTPIRIRANLGQIVLNQPQQINLNIPSNYREIAY